MINQESDQLKNVNNHELLQPIPAGTGREAGSTSSSQGRHLEMNNRASQVHLTWMSLDCRTKLENPKGIHADMGRTCKLHADLELKRSFCEATVKVLISLKINLGAIL